MGILKTRDPLYLEMFHPSDTFTWGMSEIIRLGNFRLALPNARVQCHLPYWICALDCRQKYCHFTNINPLSGRKKYRSHQINLNDLIELRLDNRNFNLQKTVLPMEPMAI